MDAIFQQFLNPEIAVKVFPYLMKGFGTTLLLSLLVIPLGLAGGLLVAVLPTLRRRWLSWIVIVYVDFFRAFPPLVLLLFIYFGAPFLGVNLPAIIAVAIGFLLNTSSYYGEIFRAGIESIPRGQWEAARSTGLSWWQTMVYIVVPQATRNVLPDLISNTLEVVKLTTLASVVSFTTSSVFEMRSGITLRVACGTTTYAIVCAAPSPVERAASSCPRGTDSMPARKISP